MIEVVVRKKNDQITSLEVSGHALFANYGSDIVCAGVSSVMVGLLNALDLRTDYETQIDEEHNAMTVITENPTQIGQLIIEVGLVQLKTIANQFPKNVKIREVKS